MHKTGDNLHNFPSNFSKLSQHGSYGCGFCGHSSDIKRIPIILCMISIVLITTLNSFKIVQYGKMRKIQKYSVKQQFFKFLLFRAGQEILNKVFQFNFKESSNLVEIDVNFVILIDSIKQSFQV